jgi:hypothetical protein
MESIEIPPGVVATPTKTAKSVNWSEVHLMRWVNDRITPVGGWEKVGYTAFASRLRKMHTWTSLLGIQMTAFLCEGHCYVDQGDGVLTNVSPTIPIQLPEIGATAPGGFGDNDYSYDLYGTPRPDVTEVKPITPGYYADNWGEDLIVMTGSDGRLLRWSPSTPLTVLTSVTGAPVNNRAFVITPQRHCMLFGAGGVFNRRAWSDQEDIENWNYADPASLAGFVDIQPAAPIIMASVAGDDIVYWTSAGDMFVVRAIGLPYVYNDELVMNGSVPVSPMSMCDTAVGLVFMTSNGPWRFNGGSATPIVCPVWSWAKFNEVYARYDAAMVELASFSELWWFFPSEENNTNDRYVQWNFREGWWSQGRLSRLCGNTSTYTRFPMMSDGVSVFKHESGGYYSGGDDQLPWAKTFNINTKGGNVLSTFNRLLPDVDGDIAHVAFVLDYNIPRAGAPVEATSGEKFILSNGFVPFRDTGRDFRLTLRQTVQGIGAWTMGETKADIIPRGSQ